MNYIQKPFTIDNLARKVRKFSISNCGIRIAECGIEKTLKVFIIQKEKYSFISTPS